MDVVERKRPRGTFLNLFDWPGKSRKKLFSSNISQLSRMSSFFCLLSIPMFVVHIYKYKLRSMQFNNLKFLLLYTEDSKQAKENVQNPSITRHSVVSLSLNTFL